MKGKMLDKIIIREAKINELDALLTINRLAFGSETEAALVRDLIHDPTAVPVVSLLAFYDEKAIGHILFTRAVIQQMPEAKTSILAPMAVIPEYQNKGIGGLLIKDGLKRLKEINVELVFVLGHINYYPKSGFINGATRFGFLAPYPIQEEAAPAWMVQELSDGALQKYSGTVRCADALMKKEYWIE